MVNLDFLRKVRLFRGLNDDQLSLLLKGCREKEYKKGDKITGEGEAALQIRIIVNGQVDLRFDLPGRETSGEKTIASVPEGMSFGWSCFVPPYKFRLSSYCASSTCKVLQIEKDYISKLCDDDPGIGYIMMKRLAGLLSKRFHDLQESMWTRPVAKIKIKVHMGTCGIAAGAREVMDSLMNEMDKIEQQHIEVETAGCMGKCPTEPNVGIEIGGEEPVIYQNMDAGKMSTVFQEHVLKGNIQSDYVLK